MITVDEWWYYRRLYTFVNVRSNTDFFFDLEPNHNLNPYTKFNISAQFV